MPLAEDVARHLEYAAEARRLAQEAQSQIQSQAFLELADMWATRAQQLAMLAQPASSEPD